MQPVLGFGPWNNYTWTIASWYVYTGSMFQPPQIEVNAGDSIGGSMTLSNGIWTITTQDLTTGTSTSVEIDANAVGDQVGAQAVLETPSSISSCNDYPASSPLTFTNLSISNNNGAPYAPTMTTWFPVEERSPLLCGENVVPSQGSCELDYSNINPPVPGIISVLAASGKVGTAFSYQIAATNSPKIFNAAGLPAGVSVSTINGAISGTPTLAGISNVTVSATNGGGTGTATLVLTIDPPAPGAPGTPVGAALGVSSISWTWSMAQYASSYDVFPASNPVPASLLANSAPDVFVQQGLSTNTAYGLIVAGVNASGAGPLSAAATVYTLAAPPTSFALVQVNISSITLSWGANTNPFPTSYEVSYWQAAGSTSTLTVLTTTATITGLNGGGTYYFSLSALNGGGAAASSGVTLSTTTQPAPIVVAIVGASGGVVALIPPTGPITVIIPPGAFPTTVDVTVKVPTILPGGGGAAAILTGTGVGVQIILDQPVQPAVNATVSVSYRPSDVSGLDPRKLILAWYDTTKNVWVPLVSSVDPLNGVVTAQTDHFSTFQIMQASPSSTVSTAKAFPNPLRPSSGQAFMTFSLLPTEARIRIYDLKGALVKDLAADATGMANWNGTNQSGAAVASGIYFVYAQGAGQRRTLEVAVQR